MAKIDFFALSGIDERGRDCYSLTINGDIYIINCGISTPPSLSLGIKKIIPDFKWFEQNKLLIKGVFIGTPSYDRFGGLEFFNEHLPNVPIYTSDVGANVLRTYFEKRAVRKFNHHPLKLAIRIMEPLKGVRIGATIVTPFRVSNSMPRSFGFIFYTDNGSIIYIDDFIISSNKNISFEDEITQINHITKYNNLLLIVGMGLVGQSKGFTNPSHRIASYAESILSDAEGRSIIACYDYDVYKILGFVQVALSKNRPVNIYSNTFNDLFNYLVFKKYFNVKTPLFIPSSEIDKTENGVILITGTPQRLFPKLEKILNDDDDNIHVRPNDTFVFAENTIPGYETFEADVFDNVARTDINNIFKLPRTILPVSASNEDHKFLVEMLKPKWIIPVSGLYMNFIEYQKAISQTGFLKTNVLLSENGKCIMFNNGVLENKSKYIPVEQQYIGAQGVIDVGASSMFEREQMKENGVVLVSLLFNKEEKALKLFNYDAVGVINLNEENKAVFNNIIEDSNKMITTAINEGVGKTIDIKELKISIRKYIDKQFEKKFNKKPLVITTLIFTKKYNNVSKQEEVSNDNNSTTI